jgi:hypothetical protein
LALGVALVILDEVPAELPPSRSQALPAVAREALLNVEKHARASAVTVFGAGACHLPADPAKEIPREHAPNLVRTMTLFYSPWETEAMGALPYREAFP